MLTDSWPWCHSGNGKEAVVSPWKHTACLKVAAAPHLDRCQAEVQAWYCQIFRFCDKSQESGFLIGNLPILKCCFCLQNTVLANEIHF